jgi:hypothetical protein
MIESVRNMSRFITNEFQKNLIVVFIIEIFQQTYPYKNKLIFYRFNYGTFIITYKHMYCTNAHGALQEFKTKI